MGCLPIVITLHSNTFLQRDCVEKYSSIARNYNQMLQKELHQMHTNLAAVGARIYYIDVYRPMMDMIQNHSSFGKLKKLFQSYFYFDFVGNTYEATRKLLSAFNTKAQIVLFFI